MKSIKGLEHYLIFTLRECNKVRMMKGCIPEDYESRVEHSLNVARLAVKFAKKEKCSKNEQYILYIAGLLHDIGKLNPDKVDHAVLGGKMVRGILSNSNYDIDESFINIVVNCIETHSDKESVNKNYELLNQILIEADVLEKMSPDRYAFTHYDNIIRLKHLTKVANKLSKRNSYLVTKTSKKYYNKQLPVFLYMLNRTSFECLLD